jgi:Thrombospondin type 1 domain.
MRLTLIWLNCGSPVKKLLYSTADEMAVDGGWSQWSAFTKCTGQCGWGIHQRTRDCTEPIRKGSGKPCVGPTLERGLCRRTRCNGGK